MFPWFTLAGGGNFPSQPSESAILTRYNLTFFIKKSIYFKNFLIILSNADGKSALPAVLFIASSPRLPYRFKMNATFHLLAAALMVALCALLAKTRAREARLREWLSDLAGVRRRTRALRRVDFLREFAEALNLPADICEGVDDKTLKPMRVTTLMRLAAGGGLKFIKWNGEKQELVVELAHVVPQHEKYARQLEDELALTPMARVVIRGPAGGDG